MQVNNWFINARVRLWRPLIEELSVSCRSSSDVPPASPSAGQHIPQLKTLQSPPAASTSRESHPREHQQADRVLPHLQRTSCRIESYVRTPKKCRKARGVEMTPLPSAGSPVAPPFLRRSFMNMLKAESILQLKSDTGKPLASPERSSTCSQSSGGGESPLPCPRRLQPPAEASRWPEEGSSNCDA